MFLLQVVFRKISKKFQVIKLVVGLLDIGQCLKDACTCRSEIWSNLAGEEKFRRSENSALNSQFTESNVGNLAVKCVLMIWR